MGTFERIRQASPVVLTVFAFVFILFMVLSDADIGGIMSTQQDPRNLTLGEINGDEIKYVEYEKEVNSTIENQRTQNPEAEINDKQIRNQVWQQLVDQVLLNQAAEQVGAVVTSDAIAYEMLYNPPQFMKQRFQDSAGNFQKQVYLELMTDPEGFYAQRAPDMPAEEKRRSIQKFRDDIIMMTDYLKSQKKQEFLNSAVNMAGGMISKTYAKRKFINENTNIQVNYIEFEASDVPSDKIEVTDEEIKEYYSNHMKRYEQEAQRKYKYVTFPITPSAKDSNSAEKKVNILVSILNAAKDSTERDSLFTEKLRDFNGQTVDYTISNEVDQKIAPILFDMEVGQIKGPIRLSDGKYFIRLDGTREGENKVVKASHILIKSNGNKDSALTEAKKIMSEVKRSNDFSEMATKYSQDPGSARKGGDVGYFGKGQMVPPFEKAAFEANKGEIVGPVESQFGYHIIKKIDEKSLEYKYSYINISPTISGITRNQIIRDAYSFKKQLEEGAEFDTLAKKLNLNAQETAFFTKDRPVLTSQYLTDLAFNKEVGHVIEPLELERYGYIVAKIVDAKKEGYAPLEDVEAEIRKKLETNKALEIQLEKAKDIHSKIKDKELLIAVAEVDNTLNIKNATVKNDGNLPGKGKDFIFTGKAMDVPVGKISEPFIGANATYIIQVTNRDKPSDDMIANQLPSYIEKLQKQSQSNAFFLWYKQFKKDADITDKRYMQYKSY